MLAVVRRTLGGATGEAGFLIAEVKASSRTSSGLLGLISIGVSKSTLPESTLESRNVLPLAELEPAGTRLRAGVGVSKPMGIPLPAVEGTPSEDAISRAFVV